MVGEYMLKSIIIITLFSSMSFAGDLYALVNKANKIQSLDRSALAQILLVNQTTWPDNKKIYLVSYTFDSDQSNVIFPGTINMSGIQAQKHYLTKVFNGVLSNKPKTVDSLEEMVEIVSENPSAVGVTSEPEALKLDKVRVLTVK